MRKSLQKTPPSGLSSELPRLPAALLAVGAPRHAPKRNGRANGSGVASWTARDETLAARVRLIEGFISRTDIADCVQHALQWLADAAGIRQTICLVRPVGESVMTTVGVNGLS